MANPFVAGNWKMHMTVSEAADLAQALRGSIADISEVTRVVCPPFVSLTEVGRVLKGTSIGVGAQNMHPETKGAFTGEVAGTMLQGLCSHVILGHSERRLIFGETDDFVNEKVKAAIDLGLNAILCVGETLDEREGGQANAVVQRQLTACLAGVPVDRFRSVVVAYEPIWAIGTGRAATPEMAQEMLSSVRTELARLADAATAAYMPVLYGGSVNAKNADELAAQVDIDGALVGGASLVAEDFTKIVKAFAVRAT